MTLKVKLFDTEGQEVSDITMMNTLKMEIEALILSDEKFKGYDYHIKVYGEIIPIR